MLVPSSYPANEAERTAVSALLNEHHEDGHGSVTRTGPNNTGDLQVEVSGKTFIVDEEGNVTDSG